MQPTNAALCLDRSTSIRTWSGIDQIAPLSQQYRPQDTEALASWLLAGNRKLRVCGARYSSPALLRCCPETWLLDMSLISGLQHIDKHSATFAAGTLLKDVFAILLEHDFLLPCSPGVISEQTLAGALATGTHGQGLYQSALSDAVRSLDVITVAGDRRRIDQKDPEFGAFLLSLGVLAIVTAVTLCVIPNRAFRCRKSVVDFSTFCDIYPALNRDHTFVKAWWFPHARNVHLWCVDPIDVTSRGFLDGASSPTNRRLPVDGQLNGEVARSRDRMARDSGMRVDDHACYQTVDRFSNFQDTSGNIYEILCKGIPAPQRNTEIGVPFSSFTKVARAIDKVIQDHQLSLHYPVILRTVGASDAWLSPAHGGATSYFGTVVYTDDQGRVSSSALATSHAIEQVLAEHDGKPHWGKFFHPEFYSMRHLYPQLEKFRTLRTQLDPTGLLDNPFVTRLIG